LLLGGAYAVIFSVANTIAAARWLVDHRDQPSVLTVQGASPAQFTGCAEAIIPMLRPGDMLGFGGFAYTGKAPARLMPILRDSAERVIPMAARAGVRHIHIWGVCYARALGALLHLCDNHGMQLSTDSAGPVVKISRGEWGYADWYKKIPSPPLEVRGQVVADHVQAVRHWLANLRDTRYYGPFADRPRQMMMFDMGG